MPDPILILKAMAAAAVIAAVVVLHFGFLWRNARAARAAGPVVGVAVGFALGVWLLGMKFSWPPREDLDRLTLVLLPAAVVVELAAAFVGRWRWVAWLPRLVLTTVAARILLDHSSYLTDLAGPGTREWTAEQTIAILAGLAAALTVVWAATAWLARRSPGRAVPFSLAGACAGAGVLVMLTGYASGGQLGLPLAAALAAAAIASLAVKGPPEPGGMVGLGVVGLFSILMIGRFFGNLSTVPAVVVFAAPLLGWLPELAHRWPRVRAALGVVLVGVPVIVVLALAAQKFVKDSKSSAPGSSGPSIDDYANFK